MSPDGQRIPVKRILVSQEVTVFCPQPGNILQQIAHALRLALGPVERHPVKKRKLSIHRIVHGQHKTPFFTVEQSEIHRLQFQQFLTVVDHHDGIWQQGGDKRT